MKKSLIWLVTVLMVLGLASIGVSAAAAVKYTPALSETDNGANGWYVGTNVDVDLKGDNGFSLTSINGEALNANVAWAFTYGQLKQTPYLHLNIGNDEGEAASPYMKIYFAVGSQVVTVAPFEDNSLEHWVKAGAVYGENCANLKAAVDAKVSSPTDETQILMCLYHDPEVANSDPLLVDALFLSDKEVVEDNKETGVESAVAVAVAAVMGAGALMVISRKK